MTVTMMKRLGMLTLAVMLVLSGTGCQANKSSKSNNKPKAQSVQKKTAIDPATKKITDEVMKVKGVSKATVLVHNPDVLIGIDVKEGEHTATVEDHVRYKVESSKPGYFVHVTSNKKLHQKIKKLSTKMSGKKPGQAEGTEVGVIILDIGQETRTPFR